MNESDLVYLVYALPNTAYFKIVAEKPADVTVNLEERTWTQRDAPSRPYPIGKPRSPNVGDYYATIGVYERNNLDHMSRMIRDSMAQDAFNTGHR